MYADRRDDVDEVYAGDIAAVLGLKDTFTGDTLCDPHHPVVLESITFPEPVISVAIEPKTLADQENRIGSAKLSEKIRRFVSERMKIRDRPLFPVWANCIWRLLSIG